MSTAEERVLLRKVGRTAIITLNNPGELNAMQRDDYYRLGCLLQQVAQDACITCTVVTGVGRYFSAGANVKAARPSSDTLPGAGAEAIRQEILRGFVAHNLDVTRAFYTHPKILVAALNGPAVGLSAALLGFCDFVYAAPHAFVLTPFSSLGLVTEGGASVGFVQRMGLPKANEALIMSRRIPCDELVACGFVNKVFRPDSGDRADSDGFLAKVLAELDDRLGSHLNQDSLLQIKKLVRAPYLETLEAQGVREVVAGMQRFVSGAPQEEFRKIASGEKRHKL